MAPTGRWLSPFLYLHDGSDLLLFSCPTVMTTFHLHFSPRVLSLCVIQVIITCHRLGAVLETGVSAAEPLCAVRLAEPRNLVTEPDSGGLLGGAGRGSQLGACLPCRPAPRAASLASLWAGEGEARGGVSWLLHFCVVLLRGFPAGALPLQPSPGPAPPGRSRRQAAGPPAPCVIRPETAGSCLGPRGGSGTPQGFPFSADT